MNNSKPEIPINKFILLGLGFLFISLVSCPQKKENEERPFFHKTIDYKYDDDDEIPRKKPKDKAYYQKRKTDLCTFLLYVKKSANETPDNRGICELEIEK